MKLTDLQTGQKLCIESLHPSLGESFLRRLREIGFAEGERVEFLRRIPFGGPLVFRVHDTVFSIEESLAKNIEGASVS